MSFITLHSRAHVNRNNIKKVLFPVVLHRIALFLCQVYTDCDPIQRRANLFIFYCAESKMLYGFQLIKPAAIIWYKMKIQLNIKILRPFTIKKSGWNLYNTFMVRELGDLSLTFPLLYFLVPAANTAACSQLCCCVRVAVHFSFDIVDYWQFLEVSFILIL